MVEYGMGMVEGGLQFVIRQGRTLGHPYLIAALALEMKNWYA